MTGTRQVFGWSIPASDAHFEGYLAKSVEMLGRRAYQPHHIDACLKACAARRTAVDIGAHVGFWSYYLAAHFRHVHAFEPVAEFARCFRENVTQANVTLHETALGSAEGRVAMASPAGNTGMTHVAPDDGDDAPLTTLDAFSLTEVDFIKIDVEGYERFVIDGARKTLAANRPVVIVEQKSGADRYGIGRYDALAELQDLGAVIIHRVVDDFILAWPGK